MQRVSIVHHLEHMLTALEWARTHDVAVTLQTAPGLIAYAGALYVAEMLKEARTIYPQAELIVDCEDDAGAFFAAIRCGLTQLRASTPEPVMMKLRAIAQETGATLHEEPYEALDLRDAHNPESALHEWFCG